MYRVDDSQVASALAELPPYLLPSYLELRAALEITPDEIGAPLSSDRPDGMRTATIGPDHELIVFFGKWADPQRVVAIYELVF